ncbi:MAG: hypothetical protein ABIU05_20605, partial [Nitrospirales bacterium]
MTEPNAILRKAGTKVTRRRDFTVEFTLEQSEKNHYAATTGGNITVNRRLRFRTFISPQKLVIKVAKQPSQLSLHTIAILRQRARRRVSPLTHRGT